MFKTDFVMFRLYLYSRMENLSNPTYVYRSFNTIVMKIISAHDKASFQFIFLVPTISNSSVPTIPEGNSGDGDDDDDK